MQDLAQSETSPDLKLFGKNTLIYACGIAALRLASLVLTPIYVYSLTMSDYGLLALLTQTFQIMVVFIDMGTKTGFLRFAREYRLNADIGTLLGSSLAINIVNGAVVMFICGSVLMPLMRVALHTEDVFGTVLLTAGAALCFTMMEQLQSFYQATHQSSKVALASLSSATVMIIVSAVFLRVFHLGVKSALMAQIVAYGGCALVLGCNIASRTGLRLSLSLVRKLYSFGAPLLGVLLRGSVTQGTAFYFLSYFSGLESVAMYSLGMKIAQIPYMMVILPFQTAYEPFVYGQKDTAQLRRAISRLLSYLLVAFAFVAFAVLFFTPGLLQLIAPPQYAGAWIVVLLILPTGAFQGVQYVGESLLGLSAKTHVTGLVVASTTGFSVLCNYLLIARWGTYGAIATFDAAMIGSAVLVMMYGLRNIPIRLENKRLAVAAALSAWLWVSTVLVGRLGIYVYYAYFPFAVAIGVAAIYASNVWDDREKMVIRNGLYWIRTKLGVANG